MSDTRAPATPRVPDETRCTNCGRVPRAEWLAANSRCEYCVEGWLNPPGTKYYRTGPRVPDDVRGLVARMEVDERMIDALGGEALVMLTVEESRSLRAALSTAEQRAREAEALPSSQLVQALATHEAQPSAGRIVDVMTGEDLTGSGVHPEDAVGVEKGVVGLPLGVELDCPGDEHACDEDGERRGVISHARETTAPGEQEP